MAEHLALAAKGAQSVMVAEISSNEDSGVRQIVAFSIWRMPGTPVKEKKAGRKTFPSLFHLLPETGEDQNC